MEKEKGPLTMDNMKFEEMVIGQNDNRSDRVITSSKVADRKPQDKSQPVVKKIKLSEIVIDEDIYPRRKHDPILVQKYTNDIEVIERSGKYISVSTDLTLLDGRHRYLAYLNKYGSKDIQIPVYIHPVKSKTEKFDIAVESNNSHGKQWTQEDKKKNVLTYYTEHGLPVSECAKKVSVRKATALKWTKTLREDEEQQLNTKIYDLHLACHTASEISQTVGIGEQTVRDRINKLSTEKFLGTKKWKLAKFGDFDEDKDLRPIYNVWLLPKNPNPYKFFGVCHPSIIDNLLSLYTEPFDIVIDAFAGAGTTIDVCKRRSRRYWISDRKPFPARIDEIRKLDIAQELPSLNKRWSKVSLTFLDPPYWHQAKGRYSNAPEDLGNMSLKDFNKNLSTVINRIAKKQSKGFVALLIQPTQWKSPDKEFTDHAFDMIRLADTKRLKLINRIACPLPKGLCQPPMVKWAKENKELLVLSREIIVWQVI